MSDDKHTSGQWRVGDGGATIFGPPSGAPSPETIASVRKKANARRIVACVNACKGISTETLEKMELTQELVRYQAAIDVQKDRCDALRVRAVEVTEQRDELEKERDSLGESLRLVAEQADKWRVETHVFMQQRDELLTLLEAIYNTHRPDNNGAYTGEAVLCESFTRRARNLIAKCKEG